MNYMKKKLRGAIMKFLNLDQRSRCFRWLCYSSHWTIRLWHSSFLLVCISMVLQNDEIFGERAMEHCLDEIRRRFVKAMTSFSLSNRIFRIYHRTLVLSGVISQKFQFSWKINGFFLPEFLPPVSPKLAFSQFSSDEGFLFGRSGKRCPVAKWL